MLPIVTLAEARAAGLPRYFTGRPCKHGHTSERCTKYGRCQACELVRNSERAQWRLKNPESAQEGQDRYRKTEKFRLVSRRRESRRRAIQKGATVFPVPKAVLIAMLKAAKICPDCRRRYSKQRPRTLDHVLALASGGIHALANFRIVCRSCNSSKGAKAFSSNGQGMLV